MTNQAEAVVRKSLKAVEHGDFGALDELCSENFVYQDPRFVRHGREAMKARFQEDQQSASQMVWETKAVVSNGETVMTERSNTFTINGKRLTLDIVGVFEVGDDGKIKRWREYFRHEPVQRSLGVRFLRRWLVPHQL
jgi:limonene-1,2-epoxide hydrolase